MEVENNSFLDYNTTNSAATRIECLASSVQNVMLPVLGKVHVEADDQYDMFTDINSNGEIILSFDILIPYNHPILSNK